MNKTIKGLELHDGGVLITEFSVFWVNYPFKIQLLTLLDAFEYIWKSGL